jgi:hypothetical protein
MRKSLAAIARSAISPPLARSSRRSAAPLRPDAPDGRGVRAALPAGEASMRAEMQNHAAAAEVDPDPGARPSTGAYYLAAVLGHHGCRSGHPSRRPRGAVAQEAMLSPSGPFSDSSGGSAVARRPDQRTLVLVLLPSTLGSPARLHGVVARASGCHRHVFAIAERPAMQGRGLPTLASLRGPRTVEPPRYASTAPVALVRGSCVMPGLWGFP